MSGPPACATFAGEREGSLTERIGCFAHDRDGLLIVNQFSGSRKSFNDNFQGSWSGWTKIQGAPGPFDNGPSATAYLPGSYSLKPDSQIDVFYDAGHSVLEHGWFDGSTFHFQKLDGIFNSGSCARTTANRVDCVARGFTNTNIYHRQWVEDAPNIASFVASTYHLSPGDVSTLTWNVPSCDPVYCYVFLTGEVGNDPNKPVGPKGSQVGPVGSFATSPPATASYSLIASNGYRRSVSSLTLNVGQPSNCTPKGPQGSGVLLNEINSGNGSPIYYEGTYYSTANGCGTTLTSFSNLNAFTVRLLASGHSSTDCLSPSPNGFSVSLINGQTSTSADIKTLYGSPAPLLPVKVVVCADQSMVRIDGSLPSVLGLNLLYTTQ